MNDPYPRTQPNIIATGMTIARCTRCHHQWMFDHKPDGLEVTARWCPTCIPDVLPVMGKEVQRDAHFDRFVLWCRRFQYRSS